MDDVKSFLQKYKHIFNSLKSVGLMEIAIGDEQIIIKLENIPCVINLEKMMNTLELYDKTLYELYKNAKNLITIEDGECSGFKKTVYIKYHVPGVKKEILEEIFKEL
ncbi:MAG: hypothetical protein JZD41_02300 [Thermoproteus sp.]|nr:hypothetical protein [Thermoproteus sp.]